MKKETTVYKVLTRHNKKLYSLLKIYEVEERIPLVQRYMTNQVNKPKVGKIFAFDTFEAADEYIRLHVSYGGYKKLIVYEATTSKVSQPPSNKVPLHNSDNDIIIEFWKNKLKNLIPWLVNDIPSGTVFCDDVTLVKCVS